MSRGAGESRDDAPGQPGAVARREPSELLYTATALALWTYAHIRYEVTVTGADGLRLRPGMLIVSTHRGSGDVPLLCGTIYFSARLWARRRWRLHFVTRDEFFERGFLAGYPERMPIIFRRLLYHVNFERGFSRVRAVPLRSGRTMKLAQALAQLPPRTALSDVLPPRFTDEIDARARTLGIGAPQSVDAVMRGEFADLLWQTVSADDLPSSRLTAIWRRRKRDSSRDIRMLINLMRSRQPLLIFPEGRHSPGGEIGPIRRGLEILVREGQPAMLLYAAIAYDPLTTGRVRACVSYSRPASPPDDEIELEALRSLKRTMPLTCGQIVATAVLEAAGAGRAELGRDELVQLMGPAVDQARRAGRAVDPALLDPSAIRRRLDDCVTALTDKHGMLSLGASLRFDRTEVLGDRVLLRLAAENASATGVRPSPAPARGVLLYH